MSYPMLAADLVLIVFFFMVLHVSSKPTIVL